MIFKRFRIVVSIRILLIVISIFTLFYLVFETSLLAITVIIASLTLSQIFSMIHYVEKTNRDLNRFFDAVKYEDFSQTFLGAGLGESFDELKEGFNAVLMKFQKTRAEKEEHYRYLQIVVEHIGVGLIAYQSDGEVQLINKAAKRLLRISGLKNVKQLDSCSETLVKALFQLKPGEKTLVKIDDKDELLQFVIFATEFILKEQRYTLVSIQNIQSELEEKEMEAWQNLIRVLTHEIMNSVTPISSLASTANDMLLPSEKEEAVFADETIADVRGAVQTIQKRSEGLLRFVKSYRQLTRVPKPDFKIFPVSDLFHRIGQLMEQQMKEKDIRFRINIQPEMLKMTADSQLIEQVLLNLLINAVQALDNRKKGDILLSAGTDEASRVVIRIVDNGPGILREVQERIFIPFFTTKQEGTGIGLSLARQVMRLHRGSITVQSKPDEQTVFTLRF